MKGVVTMKKLLKNDTFKVFLYSLCFCTLIYIFNNIADIYNMSALHRFICVLTPSESPENGTNLKFWGVLL